MKGIQTPPYLSVVCPGPDSTALHKSPLALLRLSRNCSIFSNFSPQPFGMQRSWFPAVSQNSDSDAFQLGAPHFARSRPLSLHPNCRFRNYAQLQAAPFSAERWLQAASRAFAFCKKRRLQGVVIKRRHHRAAAASWSKASCDTLRHPWRTQEKGTKASSDVLKHPETSGTPTRLLQLLQTPLRLRAADTLPCLDTLEELLGLLLAFMWLNLARFFA